MSHRSRHRDDRDRSSSHSSKYDRYEHRHRRDDSRDRSDRYYSSKSSRGEKSRSRYRSKSPSPYSRHSRHQRSRSRSGGHSSRHHDDHRSHRSKDYKDSPEAKPRHDQLQPRHKTTQPNFEKPQNEPTRQTEIQGPKGTTHEAHFPMEGSSYDAPKAMHIDPDGPDAVLEEEKQRIQQATMQRLQQHLEKEGKAYPPPKPQASHPIFANDGSFLEMFKSMQGNMQPQPSAVVAQAKPVAPTIAVVNPITRFQPIKRRGAKILKTGIVQKQRIVEEADEPQTSDSWSAYLKEVKRYKNVTCSDENMTRSLVK